MNFFMLSKCGEGAGLLKRIEDEGNSCCIKIKEKDYQTVYNGILEKADEPEKDAIIIVDSSGLGSEADALKKKGFKVFGGSKFADELECNRDFGFDFMKKHDINTPETQSFKTFTDGIAYAKTKKDMKLVFKPSGSLPCKLTYCSEDLDDLIRYMKFVQRYYGTEIDDFILQEFIEGSVVSTEFWVSPSGLIRPANHTVEVKKFMNDNIGPSTGCQGNLVWLAEDDMIVEALLRIEDSLIKEQFCGPIDLNAVVNEKGIFGLEWTPRFGLDAMPTFLQLLSDCDVGELIHDIVNNEVNEFYPIEAFAAGIRISIPPYPAEPNNSRSLQEELPSIGVPIRGLEGESVYLYEVMLEDDEPIHSDGTGVIAVVSDFEDNPEDAFIRPEYILEECKIPDKQYRTDLCKVLPNMYKETMEVLDNVRA